MGCIWVPGWLSAPWWASFPASLPHSCERATLSTDYSAQTQTTANDNELQHSATWDRDFSINSSRKKPSIACYILFHDPVKIQVGSCLVCHASSMCCFPGCWRTHPLLDTATVSDARSTGQRESKGRQNLLILSPAHQEEVQQQAGSVHWEVPQSSQRGQIMSVFRCVGQCCSPAVLTAWQLVHRLGCLPPACPVLWTQMTHSHTATAGSMTQWLIVGNIYQTTEQQRMMQPEVKSWRQMQLVFTERRQVLFSNSGYFGESLKRYCFLESEVRTGKDLILRINGKKLLSLNWQHMSRNETHWRIADLCCSAMDFAGLPVRAVRILTGKEGRFLSQEKLIGPLSGGL